MNGLSVSTFNVGSNGAAFGVADNTSQTIITLLLALNDRSFNGVVYNLNGDGTNSLYRLWRFENVLQPEQTADGYDRLYVSQD